MWLLRFYPKCLYWSRVDEAKQSWCGMCGAFLALECVGFSVMWCSACASLSSVGCYTLDPPAQAAVIPVAEDSSRNHTSVLQYFSLKRILYHFVCSTFESSLLLFWRSVEDDELVRSHWCLSLPDLKKSKWFLGHKFCFCLCVVLLSPQNQKPVCLLRCSSWNESILSFKDCILQANPVGFYTENWAVQRKIT